MWGAHFAVFGIDFQTMGTFVSVAFAAALLVFYNEACKLGISQTSFIICAIAWVVFAPLGGALLSIIETGEPIVTIFSRTSGSSHLGGFLLGVPAQILISRIRKIPNLKMLDAAMLSWCAGHTIGRLACFFTGDGCYGISTSSWIGMTFPNGIEPTYNPVYPTPLFESAYSFVIFIAFYWLYVQKSADSYPDGRIFFGAGSWMFLCRFAVEFIRINPKYEGLSLAQWICLPLVIGFSYANFTLPSKSRTINLEST